MISHQLMRQIQPLRETFSAKEEASSIRLSAQSATVRVDVQLMDCDRLGYLLTALDIQRIDEDSHTAEELDKTQIEEGIETLLERISYLTEVLTLVEKTDDLGCVLIRSGNPGSHPDGIYYYELILEPKRSVHLNRWCYDFGLRQRRIVPFTLSTEVFERLVNDLEEILDDDKAFAAELPPRFEAYPSIWEAEY